jgi:hypothetical protein
MRNFLRLSCFALIWLGLFHVDEISAIEYRYAASGIVQSSDNLTQRIDGEEGTANTLGIDFTFISEANIDWSLDVTGNLSTTEYSISELAREDIKSFRGLTLYRPEDNNFRFMLLANVAQVPRNRFQTQDINNLRDTTLIAAKPAYFINVNKSDKLNFSAMRIDFDTETESAVFTARDASRSVDEFSIGYDKQINATNSLSIIAKDKFNDFVPSLAEGGVDYDQTDVYLQWVVTGQANEIQVQYGRSKIEDALNRDLSDDLLLFTFARRINRYQTLTLSYTEGFDQFLEINQATETINVRLQNNDITTAQQVREHTLAYNHNGTYFQFGVNGFERLSKQVFDDNEDLQKGFSMRATYSLSRLIGTPLNSGISLSFRRADNYFDNNLTTVNRILTENTGLRYNHAYSPKLSFFVELTKRESTQESNAPLENNDSNSVFFGFTYSDSGKL